MNYEKLDGYQCALRFVANVVQIINQTPRGNASLLEQLRRAAFSIPLNIAEGSRKTSPPDRARFYSIARGSAMECRAIIDIMNILNLIPIDQLQSSKILLVRIVEMLSKMCR